MKNSYDTIIVGAGFAGLACARALLKEGVKIMVLEARARAGGRAHTLQNLSSPVELGAEFMHTADKSFLNEFLAAGLPYVDLDDEQHFHFEKGKLVKKEGFFGEIEKITAMMKPDRKVDRSGSEFMKAHAARINPKMKPLFSEYLQGFHAADPAKISEKAMARLEHGEAPKLNQTEQFRPLHGYTPLIEKWIEECGDSSDWLQLEALVQKIEWEKRDVRVIGRPFSELKAKTAVIAVPLGVLKSANTLSQIKFDPHPTGLNDALSGLEVGHVQRITFEFSERFWERLHPETVSFIHGPANAYFRVWWTKAPVRAPFLVAWQGGPKAREISTWPREKQITEALKTLSRISGKSVSALHKLMKSAHTHNWDADPYSLGAYTYIGVGGLEKSRRLSKPFGDTLVFAGEATAEGDAMATVHGAVQSGERAARQILKLL